MIRGGEDDDDDNEYGIIKLSVQLITTQWKHIGGMKVMLYEFLNSALNGSEGSASRSAFFTPQRKKNSVSIG
jgi:hypothetical protein